MDPTWHLPRYITMDRRELQQSILEKLKLHIEIDEAHRLSKYLVEDLVPLSAEVSGDIEDKLSLAAQRIIEGEPIQYITNRSDFYGYQYFVNESVLIPRPETEELVYQVLQHLKGLNKTKSNIIDIGTGSGCIPITIKSEYQDCIMSAIDISNEALRIAIRNANAHCAEVTFWNCDILAVIDRSIEKPYDVIISNPPYIPHSETDVMGDSTVKHEPHIALFTDDEFGLVFYQRIADICEFWLAQDGAIFLELNEYHSDKIKDIYLQNGSFSTVEIIDDMQGKPRILKAVR